MESKLPTLTAILKEIEVGNVLFGDKESHPIGAEFARLQGSRQEENTPEEEELFQNLYEWFQGGTKYLNGAAKYLTRHKKELQTLKRKFADMLEPTVSVVYRAVHTHKLPEEDRKKLLPHCYKTFEHGEKLLVTKGEVDYSPTRAVQSWTTKKKVADTFSDLMYIHKLDQPDDWFMNPDASNIISNDLANGSEFEIIRISDRPARCHIAFYAQRHFDTSQVPEMPDSMKRVLGIA